MGTHPIFESDFDCLTEMDDANLEIARPVHPLPDEIANLSLDETVCKYCGISYLIHREVARLQDQVQKLQAEIESSAEERENARAILELNDKYKIENEKLRNELDRLTSERKQLSSDNSQLRGEKAELGKKVGRMQIVQRENGKQRADLLRNFVTQ